MIFEENLTLREAQNAAGVFLQSAGIDTPKFDARILLAGALQIEMPALISSSADILDPEAANDYARMIKERANGKPVHRILGYREFFGRQFHFAEDSLEPRPETELLIEKILEDVDRAAEISFAEIGVGSGAIIVSLLAELPSAKGLGIDISKGAISDAKENAGCHKVLDRAEFCSNNCLSGITDRFDLIVSNPPYIPSGQIAELSREVREFDPRLALDGGEDGLELYRKILQQARNNLKADGRLYFETGQGQHKAILSIATEMGWGLVSSHLDLCGLERIIVLQSNLNWHKNG